MSTEEKKRVPDVEETLKRDMESLSDEMFASFYRMAVVERERRRKAQQVTDILRDVEKHGYAILLSNKDTVDPISGITVLHLPYPATVAMYDPYTYSDLRFKKVEAQNCQWAQRIGYTFPSDPVAYTDVALPSPDRDELAIEQQNGPFEAVVMLSCRLFLRELEAIPGEGTSGLLFANHSLALEEFTVKGCTFQCKDARYSLQNVTEKKRGVWIAQKRV